MAQDVFRGRIGRTLRDSEPWWPPRREPPAFSSMIPSALMAAETQ